MNKLTPINIHNINPNIDLRKYIVVRLPYYGMYASPEETEQREEGETVEVYECTGAEVYELIQTIYGTFIEWWSNQEADDSKELYDYLKWANEVMFEADGYDYVRVYEK